MERKKNYIIIIIIIAILLFIILSGANIYNSIQSYKYGKLCDRYTEQLTAAEEANRALDDRLSRIAEIVGRLHETTERNVSDARGIIETIEILRSQIQELENICYGSDSIDSYYNYWDNEFYVEGLMN